jgi:hypothetical protein
MINSRRLKTEMPNQSEKIDGLLNDIEVNCDPAIGIRACTRFSLDCLTLIRHKLTPIAEEGLAIATAYLEGRAPLEVVTGALLKCWQYLDEKHKHAPTSDAEVSIIRAVIFPLYAQKNPGERDIVDHLSLFLAFVNTVEPHYEEEETLLRAHFSDCLKARARMGQI